MCSSGSLLAPRWPLKSCIEANCHRGEDHGPERGSGWLGDTQHLLTRQGTRSPPKDTAMGALLGTTGLAPRSEADDEDSYPQSGWDTVFLVALLLLGLPANGLVAWLAGSQARQGAGTRPALLLLSLALSDFLFLAAAVFQILEIQHGGHWPLGTAACRFYYFLWGVSYSSGLFLLAALSLDRCLLALCPRWYLRRRPARLPLWVCGGVWVLATLFSVPWLVFPEAAVWWYDLVICLDFWDDEELPLRVLEVLGGLLPFLLLLLCHVLTRARACHPCRPCRPGRPAASTPQGFARVASTLLSAYVLLRLPYQLAQLLYLAFLWDVYPGQLLWEALVYSDYLVLLSSCLSPFLGLLASADLRALLHALLASFAAALCEEQPGSLMPAGPQTQLDAGQSPPGPSAEAQPRVDSTVQLENPTFQTWLNPTAQPRADSTVQLQDNPKAQAQEEPPAQLLNPRAQPQEDPKSQSQADPTAQPQANPGAQPQVDPTAQLQNPVGQPQAVPETQQQESPKEQPPLDSVAQPQVNPLTQSQGNLEAQPPEPPTSSAPHPCEEPSPADPTPETPKDSPLPSVSEGESPPKSPSEETPSTSPT
ncbi:probable G-protein coupled receptor 152 [Erinaceus europaeus]|uniref:Probable G-protein coupled receptor 152 n=1 Tax=Erinaceus europaeus TaxID=9365 RepID=A0ABM3W9V8_ERIEU|nr:probable G-protein coupled receptor 152 [Erinaceus europaeus]